MTKELARTYYKDFQQDPDLFMDMTRFCPYVYSDESSDAQYQRNQRPDREYLAVMLEHRPIGEIILKQIDRDNRCCTLSICLQNDSVKNKGYGTRAEILALEYAFDVLGMETVHADAVNKNHRSQHVLEKAGFVETHTDALFHYYRCDKDQWRRDVH